MGISFAGVDLLLEDRGGKARNWLDRVIPFEDIRHISEWPKKDGKLSNLTQPNWSPTLRPKLNTWYSPTGASRWAFGFFLVDGTRKQQIINAGSVGDLVINDVVNQLGRSTFAYCLPPHPVSALNSDPNSLWILPLVDSRYFWQFQVFTAQATIPTTTPFNTWNTLFNSISNLAGIAGIDADTSLLTKTAYLNPHPWTLSDYTYQNAGVQLDAWMSSIGLRLVPKDKTLFGGMNAGGSGNTYEMQDYTKAFSVLNTGFAPTEVIGAWQVGVLNAAEGDLQCTIPSQITISFRGFKNGLVLDDHDSSRYTKSFTPSPLGFTTLITNPKYQKTIRSTALANFTNSGNVATPDNQATLDALAQQIATDVYGWLSWFQDQSIPGVSRRLHTGFDDYWEFSMEWNKDVEDWTPRSRVHSAPHNFTCDDLLHWDPTLTNWTGPDAVGRSSRTWEYGQIIYGTLDSNLSASGTASISLTGADVPFPTDATQHVVVTDVLGASVSSGTTVIAVKDGTKWAVLDATTSSPTLRVGHFGTTIVAGGNGTFNLDAGGNVTAVVPYGVCIGNGTYLIASTDAGDNKVVNPSMLTHCQYSGGNATVASGNITVTIFSGTAGSEAAAAGNVTVSAFHRKGVVYGNKTYELKYNDVNGFEIGDPTLSGVGKTDATHNKGASGTISIFGGTLGSETDTTINLTAWNRFANVASSKWVRWAWNDDSAGFDLAAAEC